MIKNQKTFLHENETIYEEISMTHDLTIVHGPWTNILISRQEYRDGNRRQISCLIDSLAVKVLQAFSEILGEAVSLESHT